VTARAELFLGIIAAATLVMALVQIGLIVTAGVLARRVARLADEVEREIRPVFAHLQSIGRDASRAAALATAQVERADRLFADIAVRIEQALDHLQSSVNGPVREGRAIMSAVRAAIRALRDLRAGGRARPSRGEEDDALFI
jgi:hypothetical protein